MPTRGGGVSTPGLTGTKSQRCTECGKSWGWAWLDCGPGRSLTDTSCAALGAAEGRQPLSSGGRDKGTCGQVLPRAREGKWGDPRPLDEEHPVKLVRECRCPGMATGFRGRLCAPSQAAASPHLLVPGALAGQASSCDTGLRLPS